MKCINCGTDSNYRERRASGRCRVCGRRFALEPKLDKGITDATFKLAIEAVSDSGRLSWTDEHLYYDVCRRARRRRLLHRLRRRALVSLDRTSFDFLYARWIEAHGEPGGRLTRRGFGGDEPVLPAQVEALGFERLVVCADDAIADTLLANAFHADQKCPVLSVTGYPAHVYEALLPLLREHPPETVVVVHDADWDGCRLARTVTDDSRWFAGVELPRVVDAGLRPADARRYRGLWQKAGPRFDPTGLPEEEVRWLGTYRLDLAVARPRVLMSVLARVLGGEAEAAGADDAPAVWWYPETWGEGDDDVG